MHAYKMHVYEPSRQCISRKWAYLYPAKNKSHGPFMCWVACGGVLWCPRMVPVAISPILGSYAGSGSKVKRVSMLRANAATDELDSEGVIKGEL
jgi:hypothetical protein